MKILKYVETSFRGKPSFIIKMNGIKYLSNGCVFVEYNNKNVKKLINKYDCRSFIDELMQSKSIKFKNLTNGRYMFYGCTLPDNFNPNLEKLTCGYSMFEGCTLPDNFNPNLENLTDGRYMFYGCTLSDKFNPNLEKLTKGLFMFECCTRY